MLKKVAAWGHRYDRDWRREVEREFSRALPPPLPPVAVNGEAVSEVASEAVDQAVCSADLEVGVTYNTLWSPAVPYELPWDGREHNTNGLVCKVDAEAAPAADVKGKSTSRRAVPAVPTKPAPSAGGCHGRPLALLADGSQYRDFVHGYTYQRLPKSATAVRPR
jgi:hypothetical protein